MIKNVIDQKNKEKPFQMFFLKNDQNETVETTEVDEIEFEYVKRRLERGESVFITHKPEHKPNMRFIAYEPITEPWYFIHI